MYLDEYNKKQLMSQTLECEKFSFSGMTFHAYVVKVTDGDTVHVVIKTLYGIKRFVCRILYINTPELRNGGIPAKEEVERFTKDKICYIHCEKFDNFGRMLITLEVDGVDLGNHLLEKKLAVKYEY